MYEEDKEQAMLTQPPLVDHVKHESSVNNYVYGNEEFHGATNSTWSQIVSVPSSSSSKSNMLDFSNSTRSPSSDPSSDQVIMILNVNYFMINQSKIFIFFYWFVLTSLLI